MKMVSTTHRSGDRAIENGQMDGKRFIRSLRLKNLLSYGSEGQEVELQPLNVLIGSNASGKSNLIETLGLLRATPTDLTIPIREGGGIADWLWKGVKPTPTADIEAIVDYPDGVMPLRYRLSFTMVGQRMELVDEAVENEKISPSQPLMDPKEAMRDFYYRYQHGSPVLSVRTKPESRAGAGPERAERRLRREDLQVDQSVLSQRKDPDQYPELTYLGRQFGAIRLYREWNLSRYTAPRLPQRTDLPQDFLLEDASNLALVVNNLEFQGAKSLIVEKLQQFYYAIEGISTPIQGGTVQLFFQEKGLQQPIPATRLSDGTLRYLCLLSILCHPAPPPLICIEEPELGLHPDVIPTIADLLVDASQRTQLIVTTHSDTLVSALSTLPEAVLVCERDDQGSQLRRLEPDQLKTWLEKYFLGDLWRMGEIGGRGW